MIRQCQKTDQSPILVTFVAIYYAYLPAAILRSIPLIRLIYTISLCSMILASNRFRHQAQACANLNAEVLKAHLRVDVFDPQTSTNGRYVLFVVASYIKFRLLLEANINTETCLGYPNW